MVVSPGNQGPNKYALDASLSALAHIVAGGGSPATEAITGVLCDDVAPILTVLRHHSSRIQVGLGPFH